jgi:serine/threonine protein kinase
MANTLEGQTLGKYRVLEALGRGGMAQVYRAYHPQLDRYVAVKVLRSDLVEQDEFLGRFRREAHAVSGLRHPAIVQVFDFDVQDEVYYMVMELLEGDTLRARLNQYRVKGERMPLPEILRILKDVLGGLYYAHSEGVIHRDIKPANIMLTKRGQAVLTDFGIAQIVGATQYTVSGALMGTLNYMAPEQGLKGACDARSDIYSLGIVFYEMLTGYTPFDADTPLAILLKHLNDPLPLPSQMDPTLPVALEHIVLKSLAKEPADRFQSAQEMLTAIEKALESEIPEGARRVVPPPGGISPNAVFSGKARQQILGQRVTEEDTDFDVQLPPSEGRAEQAPFSLSPVMDTVLPRVERFARPLRPVSAVFISLTIFTAVNLFAAILSTASGHSVFEYGWAFEIFLVSALLAFIGWGTQTPWLLTPGIIVFANAALLAYSAITGRWDDWVFLWMFEPLIVGLAIYLPKRLTDRPNVEAKSWGRVSGMALAVLAISMACLTCWISFIVSLFSKA